MTGWKPKCAVMILTSTLFFGMIAIYGTDTVTGTVVGGNISIDTIWSLAGSPYIVMENVIVDPGVTLTIDPGVEVKFDPPGLHDYLNIFVEGVLVSVGLVDMPINFTSNSASPGSDWDYVQINATGIATLKNSSFSSGGGLNLLTTTKHNITGNAFNHYAHARIQSPGHYVANNRFSDRSGISLESVNNTIDNNSLSGSSIWLSVGNNVVSNNRLSQGYAGTEPPIVVDTDSNNITGNTLSNTTTVAIRVRGSLNLISANSVTSCKEGIELSSIYDNNTVSYNEISGCQIAIDIPGSDDNKILWNRIEGGSYGIKVGAGDRNQIVGNEVSGATSFGIQVRGSTGNLVHHNVLIDNAIQAEDDQTSNSWDNGYPSGGNYWSDYLGNDFFQGPNQIIPGSDGIGDTPYPVNPNGTDRFPLTDPTTVGLPPRNVDAHLLGAGYENVTISWNLSWNDGHRANDTTGYEIFRSTIYEKGRGGYASIAILPNQTKEFTDVSAGNGNPDNFFYYVCAINGTGNSSCTVDQVGKFTRNLTKGWNLMSFPLIVNDTLLRDSLRTTTVLGIRQYDANNPQNPWREYSSLKPYEEFVYVNASMGYWLNVENDSAMVIAGKVPTSTDISLRSGWNLVGYPSFSRQSINASFNGLPLERVEGFNGSSPPYLLQDLQLTVALKEGEGYWIKVSSDCIWHVEN